MSALAPNIQRWVDALRSGVYRQTTGRLHDDVGFCCLGVCRDILGTTWEVSETLDGVPCYESDAGEDTELDLTRLPDDLRKFLSREDDDLDYQHNLISFNDDGESFSVIADWIEANAVESGR